MAPRRHRSTSNVQGQNNTQNAPTSVQRIQTPSTGAQIGIQPTVYQSNMKVLLRREPSITAIIDQFSHVCLYHHNGQKWEKNGYEGSMFLFEKSTYPTYGFYILNRMGTDDYIRPIYPEDDMEVTGDYLMCNFHPDYTKTRLEMGLPYPIPEEHYAAFEHELSKRIPPGETQGEPPKSKERKKGGRSVVLGLWMYSTDAREPLKDVMVRLHSYIKSGRPYPDEYKYGPGRPPPPNPHLRTTSRASLHTPSQDVSQMSQRDSVVRDQAQRYQQAHVAPSTTSAELDKLFAKLIPSSVSTPLPTMPSNDPSPGKSVHDLFAAINSGNAGTQIPPPQAQAMLQHPPAPVAETPLPRGQALLKTMFASVTPATSSTKLYNGASPTPTPSHVEEITIASPKPTSSALPQILNPDVISTLLGMGPDSRASSAAPSSVSSRRSNPRRYEGDNEYSEGDPVSDGMPSRSNTTHVEVHRRRGPIPTFSVQDTASSESEGENSGRPTSSHREPGDVTPRPPAGGLRLPPASPPHFQHKTGPPTASLSAPNIMGATGQDTPTAPRERALVPFEASSELWPYPRAPLDDRSFEHDDVVELEFSDTRALSDPAIFSSRLKEKQKKKGKKSRREREEDKVREKAEIERGWDMPAQGHGQPSYPPTTKTAAVAMTSPNGVNATSSEAGDASTPKQTKTVMNGASHAPRVNGQSRNGALDSVTVKDAILSAVNGKVVSSSPTLQKTDFVTELLTLIHTDGNFVEGLWQDYLKRTT
ncbi:hypothetical protein BC628DRAFT_1402415 [Trametes gibbosa]|nr:hypothetical protein BC628DRAFT_1402415 [Trametes gibbosa]